MRFALFVSDFLKHTGLWLPALLCFVAFGAAQAQDSEEKNLIPNPGFEEYSSFPIGWFYLGRHFSRVQKYWFSPTQTSPDVYGPDVLVPKNWAEKGFGKIVPAEGNSCVGITTFGCDLTKPHCREYIEIQLLEKLVPGQNYALSMYVASLPGSVPSNNLGVLFSDERILHRNEDPILLKPTVNFDNVFYSPAKWRKLQTKFVAPGREQYMVIGNFFTDSKTNTRAGEKFDFAYLYLDAISLKKLPPILPVPKETDELDIAQFEKGKLIVLHNIYFEFDKADLHPRSIKELLKLCRILKKDPTMEIEIIGHTDDVGDDDYNMKLSLKRAKSVKNFLVNRGIDAGRLFTSGKGDTEPMAPNDTESGRSLNRRIELKILKMSPNEVKI